MPRMYIYSGVVRMRRDLDVELFNEISALLLRHGFVVENSSFVPMVPGFGIAEWAFGNGMYAIEAGDLIIDYFESIPRHDLIYRFCTPNCGREEYLYPELESETDGPAARNADSIPQSSGDSLG